MSAFVRGFWQRMQTKAILFLLGTAVGSGTLLFGQSCASSGQCATCGACASRLPVVAVPVLVGGILVLMNRVRGKGRGSV